MGKLAVIVILIAWAFSFLIFNPSFVGTNTVLPYWLTSKDGRAQSSHIASVVGRSIAVAGDDGSGVYNGTR